MMERKVLSDAFQEAVADRRIGAAIFLTFRFNPGFFEQEILPVFFDIPMSHAPQVRVLHLEQELRESGPIAVYYDRWALEAGAGAARTDFQRIGVSHRTGYFHPKNVLLLVEDKNATEDGSTPRQALIVASLSANLTRAGWWENVEVAHLEEVSLEEPCSYREDLLDLFALLRRVSPEGTEHTALQEIHSFVLRLDSEQRRLTEGTLAPRMFTGDRDLVDFLEELAGNRLRGRMLEVISPYFDDRESIKPLLELKRSFRPREMCVYLPRGAEGEALCSEPYWEAMREEGVVWGTVPKDVIRLSRDTDRFVHAKVYRFFDTDDRRETFFIGSVNLTNAGFGKSGNVESGFVVEREGRRKSEWWLEADERKPSAFMERSEDEGVAAGPGANLVIRFDWRSETGRCFWDTASASPPMTIKAAGATIGAIEPVEPRTWFPFSRALSSAIQAQLTSSAFLTVSIEGEPDAVILVDEEGSTHKPSLLTTLSPDDILRYWSLLTPEQKQEFLEAHSDLLDDPEAALWLGESVRHPSMDGMFGTFAHIYLSFGNLERAVRSALREKRDREAVDRLFGRKFDSLRRLVERVTEEKEQDPVRAYVTLLCSIQLLDQIRKHEPEFHEKERSEFGLIAEAKSALDQVRESFVFEDSDRFFAWLDRWFLRRASAAEVEA
jgi:hypothetical protein